MCFLICVINSYATVCSYVHICVIYPLLLLLLLWCFAVPMPGVHACCVTRSSTATLDGRAFCRASPVVTMDASHRRLLPRQPPPARTSNRIQSTTASSVVVVAAAAVATTTTAAATVDVRRLSPTPLFGASNLM